MSKDLEIDEVYDVVKTGDVVEELSVSYSADHLGSGDDDVEISLGTENGRVRQNEFGHDDFLYTVEDEMGGEYAVPEPLTDSPEEVADSVLERYADRDNGSQWESSLQGI